MKRSWGQKFNATRTVVDGISFASKLEAAVYSLLLYREKAGEISDIKCQVPVRLKDSCKVCGSPALVFKVDFSFTDVKTKETVFCEAKGVKVNSYLKREKIWRKTTPAKLEVWGGSYKRPRLMEVIS